MEAIVAVYKDWGIGRNGTQPLVLSADRRFFREMTRGKTVIMLTSGEENGIAYEICRYVRIGKTGCL